MNTSCDFYVHTSYNKNRTLIEMSLVIDILEIEKIRKNPFFRSVKTGMELGELVGTAAGKRRARIIREKGAAGDLTSGFTQELLDYDLRAIRIGAQI